ncbi:MAG: glycosyltransferase family 39 protein [Anaerolineales bacterium]|nr:glycosyltransferase family 39 protein [Anaerolineales bacterium]
MDNPNPESLNPVNGPESARPQPEAVPPPAPPEPTPAPESSVPEPATSRPPVSRPAPSVSETVLRIRNIVFEVLLGALILAGVFFRFSGNNWSEGTYLNPDELGQTNVVSRIELPSSIAEYFNTRISPLSPYLLYDEQGNTIGQGPDPGMVWGQWPSILIRAAAEGITGLQETLLPVVNDAILSGCAESDPAACQPIAVVDYTEYGWIRLLGRFLSALTDTVTLITLFAIGLRLYNRRIALLATALSALAATQIQQSHFMTIDNFGVMFAALGMYCAVRAAQKGGWGWYALFGCFYGMTLASRPNFAPLGAMILVAVIIGQWERLKAAVQPPAPAEMPSAEQAAPSPESIGNRPVPDATAASCTPGDNPENLPQVQDGETAGTAGLPPRLAAALQLLIPVGMFALAVAVTVLSFRIAQPMSFRETTGDTGFLTLHLNPDWLDRMRYAEAVSSGSGGIAGYPPAEHWANRPAIITPLISILLWGMGLPLGLAAFGGLLWAGYRTLRGVDWKQHALPVLFAGGMFLFLGTRWVKEMRYFLVIYPYLCLLAAWALMEVWNAASRTRGSWKKPLAGALVGVVLIGTLAWAWNFSEIYRTENTRLAASRWMYQNFPAAFRLTMTLEGGEEFQQGVNFYQQEIGADAIRMSFEAVHSGTVERFSLGYVRDLSGASDSLMHVELYGEPAGPAPIAQADVLIPHTGPGERGERVDSAFGPVALVEGQRYHLYVSAARGGPFTVKGAWFVDEAWDEGLPFNLDGFDANLQFDRVHATQMNIEWPEVEEKRQMLIDNLAASDYIIIQSQRRIWSVCRMPAVYPMTMEYYRALFDGRLGFELVAVFQHPFRFGPLTVSDLSGSLAWGEEPELPIFNLNPLAAEESFSVYDHAPVWIFQKRADYSQTNAQNILLAVDISRVANQDAGQSFAVLNGLKLPDDRLAEQEAGGTWSEMFSYEWIWNKYPGLAACMWWVWAVLTGWAALPLVSLIFRGLPDEGYSIAKTAGWLLVGWAAWMLGCARIPFVWTTIALVWLALAASAGYLFWRGRARWKEKIRELWKTWLTVEILFAALLVLFLLIRLGNSDLWHPSKGGEHPMDLSYFTAVLKSTSFPPYDPWFSGGYMNYYYFGFVLMAIPTKLLGTVPTIAYNLSLAALFAAIGVTAYGIAWNLAESLRRKGAAKVSPLMAGLGAALMMVVLGNLGEVILIWDGLAAVSSLPYPRGMLFGLGDLPHVFAGGLRLLIGQATWPFGLDNWYWNASRSIPVPVGPDGGSLEAGPITEFPFFSFLYADLHAHSMALPAMLLAIAGSAAMIINPERLRSWKTALPLVAAIALAVGSLWATNAWFFPASLGVAMLGLALAGWRMIDQTGQRRNWRAWALVGILAAALVALSLLFFAPYHQWYGAGYNAVKRWEGSKTPLEAYFLIHGLFLFILISYIVGLTRERLKTTRLADLAKYSGLGSILLLAGSLLIAGLVILGVLGYPVLVFAVPMMLWAIVSGLGETLPDEHRMTLGLFAAALAITCGVELIVLEGDLDRMNTVFKFYVQAWLFFALAAGVGFGWLAGRIWNAGRILRNVWFGALGVLVAAAFSYTLFASYFKIIDRMSQSTPRTLDGITFMQYSTHYDGASTDLALNMDLSEDYLAIRWMQENVKGSPVIVEAHLVEYRWGSRFTIFTGLPGVVGWNWHQRQQRGVADDQGVWERVYAIGDFYTTTDTPEAMAFLKKYNVKYVIVGQQERAWYPPGGIAKFERMAQAGLLKPVFTVGLTTVYEVT